MKVVKCLIVLWGLGVWITGVQGQPLAQYTFNDGTSKDVTGNGFDGLLLGSAAVATDPERGQVLQVNESGMQADGPFGITTSLTLSAWTKLDMPRSGRFYFGGPLWVRTDNQGSSEHYWCEMRYPGGSFVDKFDTRSANSPEGQLDGQWHHIAMVLPEDGTVKVYVDGVLAPVRDNAVKAADFGGAVGPLFFGTENATGGNAIQGYMDDIRVYDYAVTEEEIPGLMQEGAGIEFAANPSPASGDVDVSPDVRLSWKAGAFAATHQVYLGTSLADVNSANTDSPLRVGSDLTETTLLPGHLDLMTTYYWRVDSVNSPPDSTVFKGDIWSFTTEPVAYAVADVTAIASSASQNTDAENTVNGSGLGAEDQHSTNTSDMWLCSASEVNGAWIEYRFDQAYKLNRVHIWNHNSEFENFLGYGIKDALIESSLDGQTWTELKTLELAQATGKNDTGTEVSLDGTVAQSIRITGLSNWSTLPTITQVGLSEVRFYSIPVRSRLPQPASGTTDVDPGIALVWRPGRLAGQHDVYLGTNANDLSLVDSVTENQLDAGRLGLLQLGETYHWRVDEVNALETPGLWQGATWTFSTPGFINIDDMEFYADRDGQWIWATWVDGYENPTQNGSTVGHKNLPETAIVNSGSQSMPFYFDNQNAPLSEATRTFETPQNWTQAGIKTLVVYFYEDALNTNGQFYVKVNGKKVVYQEAAGTASPPDYTAWTQWNIDLASLGTDLAIVRTLSVGVDGAGAHGILYLDDIRLYKEAPKSPKVVQWFEAESAKVTTPMFVYEGDTLASNGQFIGTDEALGDATANPPETGIATYQVQVPAGAYRLALRMKTYGGSNTLWVRIPDATTNTVNHPSGWALFDTGLDEAWHWEAVNSRTDGGALVEFSLPAGTHSLDIAYREDGLLIDAIALISLTD